MLLEAVVFVLCVLFLRPGPTKAEAILLGQLKTLLGSARRKPAAAPDQKSEEEALGAAEQKTTILHDVLHSGKSERFIVEALENL